MASVVNLLEDALLSGQFNTAADAVSFVLEQSGAWISLEDRADLYNLADIQIKSGMILRFFKEDNTNEKK